jgi:ATP-dependent Clp protease ATP-binding subunit ClpB
MGELRDSLRPEFLNRIDETIMFRPLSREQIGAIVTIQLVHLDKLLEDRKIRLEITPAARARLAEEGYDPVYGARPLKRAIQQRLQNPLAVRLLQGDFVAGDTVLVDAGPTGYVFKKA